MSNTKAREKKWLIAKVPIGNEKLEFIQIEAVEALQAERDALNELNTKLELENFELKTESPSKELLKENAELRAELERKNEDGCCIVEHGYRIAAEHERDTYRASLKKVCEALELAQAVYFDHFIGAGSKCKPPLFEPFEKDPPKQYIHICDVIAEAQKLLNDKPQTAEKEQGE